MKYNFFFLIIIVLSSCSKKTQFINEFDCEVVAFQNLERIEDVKKLFSVYYPDSWKTNLYYDKNQSSIYTADTTKQLKETMLLDITHISSELVFDSNFIRKFNSNLKQQQLTVINSNKILFRDKPTFYSEAKKGNIELKRFGSRNTLVPIESVQQWIDSLPTSNDFGGEDA